jgi:hypothetical protein
MARPAKNWYSERAVRDLLATISDLADHVEEMGCTCARSDHNAPGGHAVRGHLQCMGVGYARKARRQLASWQRRLDAGGK